jgi:acyl dehydratase
MTTPRFAEVRVGDALPPLSMPPLDRMTLALFAGASGDHVPLHIDIDAARRAGMPDVFGHGMLSMAYLGRLITHWSPQSALRSFNVRFEGITHLGNALTCSGRVVETFESHGEKLARIEIRATNQYGESKTAGDALVVLG